MPVTSVPLTTLLAFGVLWVLGAAGSLYFWFGSDAEDKRQLYPWFTGLMLFATLGFVYFAVEPPLLLVCLFALVGTVSAAVHVRSIKFCPECAQMVYRGLVISRFNYCPRCGRPLDQPHTPARAE